ncbi:MAG: zinc ribbon domain-containing protein [Armatimonadota bacterium]|nr:zinc ribbon domain-containing protein [Armatimonadota bacterium]
MPVYEFTCQSCGEAFEALVWSHSEVKDVGCPHCGSQQIRRRISAFAAIGRGRSTAGGGEGACSTGGG